MEPLVFINSPIPQINTVSNFLTLLEGLLSPVSTTRSECLVFFEQLKQTHFPFLLEALTEILFHAKDSQGKILALVLIRQVFANKSPQEVWNVLQVAVRKKFIQNLLLFGKNETCKVILKHLAEVVNEFNVSFHFFFKKPCLDLVDDAIELCGQSGCAGFFGLSVISGFFVYFNECFADSKESLFRIFELQLKSGDKELKVAAVHAFTSLVLYAEMSQAMYFSQLLKPLLRALIAVANQETLERLVDSAGAEPFFYYKKFSLCLEFVRVVLRSDQEDNFKFMACKFVVDICADSPDCTHVHIKNTIQVVRTFISTLSLAVPDNVEIDYVDLSAELISEVIKSHLDYVEEFVMDICESVLLSNQKSYVLGVLQLEKIVMLLKTQVKQVSEILMQTSDDYGTLITVKCIGNIWKYCKYSNLNITNLLSINLQGLTCPLEIIQIESSKSLSYFIERGGKSFVLKQSSIILNYLFDSINYLNQKENLLLICKYLRRFKSELNFQEIPEKLLKISNSENFTEVLLCYSEMQDFYPVNNLVQGLIESTNSIRSSLDQNNLATWQLIFKHFPECSSSYIDQILPSLLSILTESLKVFHYSEALIQTLIYLTSHKSSFKYLSKVNWIAARLFESHDEEVQTLGSHLSVTILKTMRLHKDPAVHSLAKIYTKSIWKAFMIHSEVHFKLENLQALKDLMETFDSSFLTQGEADWLIQSLFECMKNNTGFELMVEECRFAAYVYSKHNDLKLDLLHVSIDVLTGYLQMANEEEKFIVLKVLNEFLEVAGNLIGERLENVFQTFFRFSEYFDEKIREQALMGFGSYSGVVKSDEFAGKASDLLQILERCISNEQVYNHRYFNRCKNSAVLTVGILIFHHPQCFDLAKVVQGWVWLLPLRGDKIKEKKSELILVELLKRHSFSIGTLGEKNIIQIKSILKESYCVDLSTSLEIH